jgi:hypothetical protein
MGDVADQDVAVKARGLMPQLRGDLEALVRIPSVSVPGRVDDPLLEAFELTSRLFAEAGVEVGRLDLPDTAPVVTGEIPAPPGSPTVPSSTRPVRRGRGAARARLLAALTGTPAWRATRHAATADTRSNARLSSACARLAGEHHTPGMDEIQAREWMTRAEAELSTARCLAGRSCEP